MSITGNLADFSLPELFKFLDQGEKTGTLNLTFQESDSQEEKKHYVWFRQGNIITASNSHDGKGLMSFIQKKKWLNQDIIDYKNKVYANDAPFGLSLKSNGFLDSEQLKMLFYSQVMRQVCNLFQLQDALFSFEEGTPLPFQEMTGLSSPGTDLTLAGLRALRDWSGLSSKLPEETSGLKNIIEGEPKISINKLEKSVWDLSDAETTIKEMSKQLEISLEKTKEVGFRLIAIGLAEEIPMVAMTKVEPKALEEEGDSSKNSDLSQSFLNSLMGFLTEV
jgi:hypothetical protein